MVDYKQRKVKMKSVQHIFCLFLLLICVGLGKVYGQATPITIVNTDSTVAPGDSLRLTSTNPIGQSRVCDSLRIASATDTFYFEGATMASNGPNGLNLLIPSNAPCGTYELKYFPDATGICGGSPIDPADSSVAVTLTIQDQVSFVAGIDTSYCLGETNPVFGSLIAAGSSPNPTFFTDAGANIINSATGELFISTGAASLSPFTVGAAVSNSCVDTARVTIYVNTYSTGYTFQYFDNVANFDSIFCPILPGSDAVPIPALPDSLGSFTGSAGLVFAAGGDSTGQIDLSATPSGVYSITYVPNPDLCFNTVSAVMKVDTVDSAIFSFQPEYCELGGLETPTVAQLPRPDGTGNRGSFSILPGGIINDSTGVLDLDQFSIINPTTYTVTYSPASYCADTTSATFLLNPAPDPDFNYVPIEFCSSDPNTGPDFINSTGPNFVGVFWQDTSFSPATNFVDINGAGDINFGNSDVGGPYYINYAVSDTNMCSATSQDTIFILGISNASLAYLDDDFCTSDSNAIPSFSAGALGGTFIEANATAGLVINDSTGVIDLGATAAGTYNIQYTQQIGGCTDTVNVPGPGGPAIEVHQFFPSDIQFTSPVCDNIGTLTLATSVVAPATFSYELLLGGAPVNPNPIAGSDIAINSLTPGTYELYQFVQNNVCGDTAWVPFEVTPTPDPSFAFLDTVFCGTASNPNPFLSGDVGGTFSAQIVQGQSGTMAIDPDSGIIDLPNSNAGEYWVFYEHVGACPSIDSFRLVIQPPGAAQFSYGTTEFCTYDSVVIVDTTVTNNYSAGDWSTVPAFGLTIIDSTLGSFDPSSTTPGQYTIQYDLQTSPQCAESFSISIEILEAPQNTAMNYVDTFFCKNDPDPSPVIVSDSSWEFFSGLVGNSNAPGVAFSDTSGTIRLDATNPGTYQIIFFVDGRCPVEIRDTLTIEDVRSSAFAYDDVFYCTTDTNPIPIAIDVPNGTFTGTDNNFNPLTGILNTFTGEFDITLINDTAIANPYTITYTTPLDSGCQSSSTYEFDLGVGPDDVFLNVEPTDSTICRGETVSIAAQATGGTGIYEYNFFRVDNAVISQIPTDSLTTLQSFETNNIDSTTTLGVIVTNNAGCESIVQATITVDPTPVISFTRVPTTINSGELAELFLGENGTVDDVNYNWFASAVAGVASFDPESGVDGPHPATVEGVAASTITLGDTNSPALIQFAVVPITEALCVGDTVFDTIAVNPRGIRVFIPEVFTPNFDGVNDVWQIQWAEDIDPNNWMIEVFNRAGALVETLNPVRADWDGNFLPDGIYWWKLINKVSGQVEDTGGVTIIRKRTDL